jgi:uncharacterized protein
MFKEMRRKERELSAQEAKALLSACEYGILSTVCEDGYPYGVPISFACQDDSIYFHCAVTGQKLENLEKNNKVCFCVTGETELLPADFSTRYKSAIAFGIASEVFEDEKRNGLKLLIDKYSHDYMAKGMQYVDEKWDRTRVFKIDIKHLSGKGRA